MFGDTGREYFSSVILVDAILSKTKVANRDQFYVFYFDRKLVLGGARIIPTAVRTLQWYGGVVLA